VFTHRQWVVVAEGAQAAPPAKGERLNETERPAEKHANGFHSVFDVSGLVAA
jgi:hypothetical protein